MYTKHQMLEVPLMDPTLAELYGGQILCTYAYRPYSWKRLARVLTAVDFTDLTSCKIQRPCLSFCMTCALHRLRLRCGADADRVRSGDLRVELAGIGSTDVVLEHSYLVCAVQRVQTIGHSCCVGGRERLDYRLGEAAGMGAMRHQRLFQACEDGERGAAPLICDEMRVLTILRRRSKRRRRSRRCAACWSTYGTTTSRASPRSTCAHSQLMPMPTPETAWGSVRTLFSWRTERVPQQSAPCCEHEVRIVL